MKANTRMLAVKRAIDILGAITGLIILGPVMLLVAIAIYAVMGRPILFQQVRVGASGVPFVMYKFRTMRSELDASGHLLPDEMRLTELGRWLRSTSLDELPELWNVVRGDMSLVGPRPILPRYVGSLRPDELARMSVRPGITGWAQIHGRNALGWDERLQYDVWYVRNWSLRLDGAILLRTLPQVLRRRGVVVAPHTVMRDLDEERCGRG